MADQRVVGQGADLVFWGVPVGSGLTGGGLVGPGLDPGRGGGVVMSPSTRTDSPLWCWRMIGRNSDPRTERARNSDSDSPSRIATGAEVSMATTALPSRRSPGGLGRARIQAVRQCFHPPPPWLQIVPAQQAPDAEPTAKGSAGWPQAELTGGGKGVTTWQLSRRKPVNSLQTLDASRYRPVASAASARTRSASGVR